MTIERKVASTIKEYNLISDGDKVVVALSGGKDSTSVLYILKKMGYDVEGLMIDLYLGNWSEIHKKNMIKFCEENNVPLTIVDLKKELGQGICFIKAVLKKQKNLTGCTVCGIIKRWILNKWAKKLGADKIVTGHNLDDEAQNVLMNFLKGNILLGVNSSPATGGELSSPDMESKVPSSSDKNSDIKRAAFAQRIKPLFFVAENDIREYAKKKKFEILYDKCPCSFETYRSDTRDWLEGLDDKKKLAIVENFQKLVPKLRKENAKELKICKKCGEPSRGELCNACKIFACL